MLRRVPFLVVVIAFLMHLMPAQSVAQILPSLQSVRHRMWVHEPNTETTPSWLMEQPGAQRIGTIAKRIGRDQMEVRVYQHGRAVELFSQFQELVTASPVDRRTDLRQVAGKGIALVPSEKDAERWDIYIGVGGGTRSSLAGNIFVVKQVFVSSRKKPVEVHVDGEIHRLKPGQALLVM